MRRCLLAYILASFDIYIGLFGHSCGPQATKAADAVLVGLFWHVNRSLMAYT